MKKIFTFLSLVLAFLFLSLTLNSQDCIISGENRISNPTVSKTISPTVPNGSSFADGEVSNWECSFNTPHHVDGTLFSPIRTNAGNCLLASNNHANFPHQYAEGIHYEETTIIFQDLPNVEYCVTINAERMVYVISDSPNSEALVINAGSTMPN